jgi:hypothetical protein
MPKEMKKNKRFYLTTLGKSIFRTPHLLLIISASIKKIEKNFAGKAKVKCLIFR